MIGTGYRKDNAREEAKVMNKETETHLPRVNTENRNTGFRTWRRELNFAIDTPRSEQCRVQNICHIIDISFISYPE